MYRIIISRYALKEMERFPKQVNKNISKAIEELKFNPRPQGCKKLKVESEFLWRIRVGDYRVLYRIEEEIKVVDIRKIGHRKNIYKK